MGQLSALEADTRFVGVDVRGRTIEVRPLTAAQIPPFVRLAFPVLESVFRARKDGTSLDELAALIPLIEQNLGQVCEAIAVALNEEPGDVQQLNAGELTQMVCAVLDVNLDFFVRQATPAIARLAQLFVQLQRQTSSPVSKTPAPS
ncbi:MAG TPA: hypothetical protein VFS13_00605 [Steroidobacteraceae bacterium]|nr:hypothetical protein [Steroidobacteraceae bacterium]